MPANSDNVKIKNLFLNSGEFVIRIRLQWKYNNLFKVNWSNFFFLLFKKKTS